MVVPVYRFSLYRTQTRVTLSSTQEEYVTMATGVRYVDHFMRYVWSFRFPDRDVGCTTVDEGNKGATTLANYS